MVITPDWKGPEELFCYCLNLTKFLFRCYFLKLAEKAQSFSVVFSFQNKNRRRNIPIGSALCAQPLLYLLLPLLLRSPAVQLNGDLPGLNSKDRWWSGKRKISACYRHQEGLGGSQHQRGRKTRRFQLRGHGGSFSDN